MREIKFRGLTIPEGQWITSDEEFHKVYLNYAEKAAQINVRWVKYDSVSEFTGLKDKSGKEIYEGDKVSYQLFPGNQEKDIGTIIYRSGGFVIKTDHIHSGDKARIGGPDYLPLGPMVKNEKEVEVIGNIYENPELLEVK